MPRPFFRKAFNVTYRKIPICAIGHDVYCDTAVIIEALEQFFPENAGYPSIYPKGRDGRSHRALIRGFASYWTDRPLFRMTTGLIPGAVWRTSFGDDRAGLIGHKLNADKLESKLPDNLSGLDMHLSVLESLFAEADGGWIFATERPSAADVSLWYQLKWGRDIAKGQGIYNLTGGGTEDESMGGADTVFNKERYPNLCRWFDAFEDHVNGLPVVENDCAEEDAVQILKRYNSLGKKMDMLHASTPPHEELNRRNGILPGTEVSVAPDDTGRADPTIGVLIVMSPEEIVIKPQQLDGATPLVDVRVHFPRIGFTVRPSNQANI